MNTFCGDHARMIQPFDSNGFVETCEKDGMVSLERQEGACRATSQDKESSRHQEAWY